MKKKKILIWISAVLAVVLLMAALPEKTVLAEEMAPDDYGHTAEWWNVRNSEFNNAVTDRPAPTSSSEAWGKWAVSFGTGYNAAPTPPVIVDGRLYLASGNKIFEVNRENGSILRESEEMPGNVGYALFAPLYAEGKLFVTISDSRICAVDLSDLSIAWVSDNSTLVKGQMNSPISYRKINGTGYVCAGTWRNPGGELLCVTTDETDLITKEGVSYPVKPLSWIFDPDESDAENLKENHCISKGYYWTGAYISDQYLAIGSDDGSAVSDEEVDTAFYTLNPVNGKIIDAVYGIHGQVRSSTVYSNGALYFSTKGAKVYRIPVSEEGILGEPSFIDLGELGAKTSSCTPVVYGGKIYVGVSGKGGKLSSDGGHGFMVIRDGETLSASSYLYTISVPGYPQMGAVLSTFHEAEDFDGDGKADGRVYLYFTYNSPPGGLFYTYDSPEQTKAASLTAEESKIFVPPAAMQQYCISSVIVDTEGTLYYKNDSGYLFAVESNASALTGLEVSDSEGKPLSLDQPFQTKIQEYTLILPPDCSRIRLQLQLEEGVTAKVSGKKYQKGGVVVSTAVETSEVKIVTKKNGKSRTYTIHVQKASAVAELSALGSSMNNSPPSETNKFVRRLTPEFDKEITSYVSDWRTNGRGGSTDPASSKLMNLFLKTASDKATVKVWPLENVDTSGSKVLPDGSIKSYPVAGSSVYSLRFPVYSADITKDSQIRIEVAAQDGVTVKNYEVTFNRRIFATGVNLDPVSAEVNSGDTLRLSASVKPENATDQTITWTSSDENIAVVDKKGRVTTKRGGKVLIRAASSDGPYSECSLVVIGKMIDIGGASVSVSDQTYTGKPQKPKPKVRMDGVLLEEGLDYTLSYSGDNVNAGAATVTVTGKGDYTGSKDAKFRIKKAKSVIKLKGKRAVYTGKSISVDKPVVTGSSGKKVVTYYKDSACTKMVKKHVSACTYYVKASVAADANYRAAQSSVVKLVIKKAKNPIVVKAKTLTAKSSKKMVFPAEKAVTVKKAAGKVTYKKLSGNSKITVSKNGTVTVKKGLKKGKTYTLKIQVTAAGTTNYKAESKKVNVKVKIR